MKTTILSLIVAAASVAALDSTFAARCSNNIGASRGTVKKWTRTYQTRRAILAEAESAPVKKPRAKVAAAKVAKPLSTDPRAVAKRAARAAAKFDKSAPVTVRG